MNNSSDGTPNNPFLKYENRVFDDLSDDLVAGNVYAILDACGSEEILSKVVNLSLDKARCLYIKAAFQEHWAIAPYLVKLDASIVSWIVEEVWEEPWGIIALSTQRFDDLYQHFRKFLLVKDYEDNLLYFRFYDPRILKTFLPTCDRRQLKQFYGPISDLGFKNESADSLTLVRVKEFQESLRPV